MGLTAHAYLEAGTPNHTHLVPMGDGRVCILETEEALELLVESMRGCNESRHDGHGRHHPDDEIEEAYKQALHTLMTKDFEEEWRELQRKKYVYKRWGGHAPEALFLPTEDGKDVQLITVDRQGTPHERELTREASRELRDIVPRPEELGAKPNKHGIGWTTKRRWSTERKLNTAKRRR